MHLRRTLFSRNSGRTWTMLLGLLVAVLAPTACVLWFLNAAVENERLAVRQRLQEVYAQELTECQNRLADYWKEAAAAINATHELPPAEAFARLVSYGQLAPEQDGPDTSTTPPGRAATRGRSSDGGPRDKTNASQMPLAAAPPGHAGSVSGLPDRWFDTALVFRDGRLAYPQMEIPADRQRTSPAEEHARSLEAAGQFDVAAEAYAAIAQEYDDASVQARALLGQARALLRANVATAVPSGFAGDEEQRLGTAAATSGNHSEAIDLLIGTLQEPEYANATDAAGRLIAPSALLLAIESLSPDDPTRPERVRRLADRLQHYDGPEMSSPQRLFLMQRLHQLASEGTAESPASEKGTGTFSLRGLRENEPVPGGAFNSVAGDKFPTERAEKLAIEIAPALFASGGPDTSPTHPGRAATGGFSNDSEIFDEADRTQKPLEAAPPGHAGVSGPPAALRRASFLPDCWMLADSSGETIRIWTTEGLKTALEKTIDRKPLTGATLALRESSNSNEAAAFLSVPAGSSLPNWTIDLSLEGDDPFAAAAERHKAVYLWMASLAIGTIGALAMGLAIYLQKQIRLTRLKNDLIATVSHELKTPLSSMRVLTDTLLDGRILNAGEERDYLQLLVRENVRLSRLIDNFLTFSRMERNKSAFEFRPQRVQVLVDAALAALGERSAVIRTSVPPQLMVEGDADALVTLLVNLLDNSWKYSGEKKEIELTTEAVKGAVEIRVRDNGIGIARRHQRRIFERFYQVDRQLSRQAGGCGLGLAIVQFIAKAHQAEVRVESHPGRGSTFCVRLPDATERPDAMNGRRALCDTGNVAAY